jgi:hypothetical protein
LHEEAERMAQELRIAKIEVEIDKRRFAAEYEWRTAQAEEEFLMAQSTERTQLVVMVQKGLRVHA